MWKESVEGLFYYTIIIIGLRALDCNIAIMVKVLLFSQLLLEPNDDDYGQSLELHFIVCTLHTCWKYIETR